MMGKVRRTLETEFLVVGGGPVGSALALRLHRAGREVLLVDAGASSEKICGEGVLPIGWSVLERLGVAQRIAQKASINELVYQLPLAPDGELGRLVAPLSHASFGVQRAELSRAFADVLEESGLEVWRKTRFQDAQFFHDRVFVEMRTPDSLKVNCRYLLGADGLHSKVRRVAGLQAERPRRYSRWGSRVYFRTAHPPAGVVVTLGVGLESYQTPLGGDLCGLAFLWSPDKLGRPLPGEGPLWQRLLAHFPVSYRQTLPPDSAFFGPDRAIGPLQQLVTSPLHPNGRLALLGDAGGYLDALTGEGLCLGLAQADALADLLLAGRLEEYPRVHHDIKRRHQFMVSGLLWLLSHPGLKDRVFAGLLRAPALFRALIGFAVEHHPWHRFCHKGLISEMAAFSRGMLAGS